MRSKPIIFMGTTDFSLKALAALQRARFTVRGVYTRAPKPSGRNYKIQKSVVHGFADEQNIPVYCPKSLKSSKETELFRSLNPALVIVSSYGLIIPQDILDVPALGFINIHASLLPKWRGASPIQSSILAGDKKTGVTIIKMDAGVDTGDIISMKSIDIFPETSYEELSNRLGDLGAELIVEILNDAENRLSQLCKQSEEGVTYTQKITRDLRRINWDDSAENILRHVKAFSPLPAAWMEIDNMYLKVIDAVILDKDTLYEPGFVGENMTVTCRRGLLKLTEVQPSGKNKMTGDDFIRGRKNLLGKVSK